MKMFKLITDFGSLIIFFIAYKYAGLLKATLYTFFFSLFTLLMTYIKYKKLSLTSLISSLLFILSFILTKLSGNSVFIKVKPTFLYCTFALIFLVTCLKRNPAVRYILGNTIKFKEKKTWYILNTRFIYFFIFMACINEIIWRNLSEEVWVNFKVFLTIPITTIFLVSQIPFVIKNKN